MFTLQTVKFSLLRKTRNLCLTKTHTAPVAEESVFLRSMAILLPPLMTSRGDWMPRKSRASSLRNWTHVKRITQPWFSSHSSSSRLHKELICEGKRKKGKKQVLRAEKDLYYIKYDYMIFTWMQIETQLL